MSHELIYTSAPRGLKPGTSGFCTVAATDGMSRQATMMLESLSGYEFHFNLSDPEVRLSPVNYAHTRVTLGSQSASVLSRVAFSGADYSGRTNKIAHHFLLFPEEQLANGPAWMLAQMAKSVFPDNWQGAAQHLPVRRLNELLEPQLGVRPEPARRWEEMTGDAGWGGVLAKAIHDNSKVPAFILFKPGMELLPLFEESLALLTPEERWSVCFATYYTAPRAGCHYHWRGVLAGSPATREIARFPNAAVIDLTRPLGRAQDNAYTIAARTGSIVEPPRRQQGAPQPEAEARQKLAALVRLVDEEAEMPIRGGPKLAAAPQGARASRSGLSAKGGEAARPAVAAALRASRRMRNTAAVLGVVVLALLLTNVITLLTLWTTRRELREARELAYRPATTSVPDARRPRKPTKGREPSDSGTARSPKASPRTPATSDTAQAVKKPVVKVPRQKVPGTATKPTVKPTTKTPVVEPKKVPPAKREIKLLARHEVPVRVTKSCFPGQKTEAGALFSVAHSTVFLKPPRAMEKLLRFALDGNVLTVEHKGRAAFWDPLLTCKLQPQNKQLVWTVAEPPPKNYQESLAHLVIQVFDDKSGILYECMRKRKEPALELALRYGRDEKDLPVLQSPEEPVRLEYPWPKTLRVQHKDLKDGQVVRLDDLDKVKLVLKRKVRRRELELALDLRVDAKKNKLIVAFDTQILEGKVNEARKAKQRQGFFSEKLLELTGKIQSERERVKRAKQRTSKALKKLEEKMSRARKEYKDAVTTIRNTKQLMAAIEKAFKGIGPVKIVDAWGVAAASLALKFEAPGAKPPEKRGAPEKNDKKK